MAWGGARPGAGRKPADGAKKPNPNKPRQVAEPKLKASAPAEPKAEIGPAIDPRAWAMMLPEIEEISRRYSKSEERTKENCPFKLPTFPKIATPDASLTMAMDNALVGPLNANADGWLAGDVLGGLSGQGLMFLGYTYLSELAQRPEYRIMSETIADDATRKWIDFDVTGDEQRQREERDKDPGGYDERMADPDERKKRVQGAGKTDKVKALQDDQLRLQVKDRYYEQCRNGGFFGRTHLFHDIRPPGTDEMNPDELKSSIGDSRDATSATKVQKGFFQALRTIEPVWTYPLMYNAINPLREDWYNPQVWFVMGQEIHGTRLQTFIPHPVPDMLKPAYAFGGISLSQLAKPYVDRWLTTVTSVNQLIHSFSVMVLMTDLSTLMQPGNVSNLMARLLMFNMLRDNQGTFVVNKSTEDFKNVQASLSGLHELQAQSQEHVASINRIPLVKYTGIQPAGLNASSEGEIEVYDDTIGAYQSRVMDPNLRRTINFQQLSLFGAIDPEISHRWEVLRPMTQAEKAQKEKDDADRHQKYVDMGSFSPGEIRKVAIDDKDLPYTGLDPDDLPEPPAEEGLLGPGAGGAAKVDAEAAHGETGAGGGATDASPPFASDSPDQPRDEEGKFTFSGGGTGSVPVPNRPDAFHGSGQAYQTGKRNDPLYLTNRLDEAAGFARGAHMGGEGDAPQVHSFHMKPGKIRDINAEIGRALDDGDDLDDAITKVISEELGPKGTARYLQFLHPSVSGGKGGDFPALISLHPGQDLEHIDSAEVNAGRAWRNMQKASMATDNHWERDAISREPEVLVGDAWSETDHPRGQPENAGQFGAGGGGGSKTGRKYGGLYKSTGKGAKADHQATVEHVLKSPPRAGVSYRELLTRLVKDAPEHGGDVDKLKSHLAQAYASAADQLRAKATLAPDDAEKFNAMAAKAVAKAEALRPEQTVLAGGGEWSKEHDATSELRAFRESTRRDLVAQGIDTGLENLSAFDVKTNKMVDLGPPRVREAKFVGFTPQMVKEFENPENALELHHNHPSDTSFSPQDLDVLAFYPGMSRVYAHGHAGSTYAVDGAQKFPQGYRPIMDAAAGRGIYDGIGALPFSASDQSRIYQHVILSGLAKAGLITGYSAHLAPDLADRIDSVKNNFGKWVTQAASQAKWKAEHQ